MCMWVCPERTADLDDPFFCMLVGDGEIGFDPWNHSTIIGLPTQGMSNMGLVRAAIAVSSDRSEQRPHKQQQQHGARMGHALEVQLVHKIRAPRVSSP